MSEKIKNYINGKWQDSVSGKTLEGINPANTKDMEKTFSTSC